MSESEPLPRIRQCRSCEAPIIWTVTLTGARMPVDAEPSDSGTLYLMPRQIPKNDDAPYYSRFVPIGEREHRTLHTSHFATCPDAAAHRTQ